MHHSSSEGSALCVQRGSAAKRLAYRGFAETWVEEAIAAGCYPHMRQEPLSSHELAGEWLLVVSAAGLANPLYPGSVPDRFLDEVFLILGHLGRIKPCHGLRPWHGNVLPDDTSSRALAFRLKLVREALNLDYESFYGIMGIHSGTGEAIESGRFGYAAPDEEMLQAVCLYYDAPEEWLTHGGAEEMELHCL
jgi:hypothetical protein